jgi:RNA polymerase sigma factor (sigma-70 family)
MPGPPETPRVDADDSLPDILARLAAGDLSARDRILERCADRIRLLARRMLRRFPEVHRHDDTDDVCQLAALRLHRALGEMARGGESPRSIMALAAAQVRRTVLDLARRNRGRWSHAANHDTNVDARGAAQIDRVPDGADALDRWEAFHEAVESLPPLEREVVHLAWYMGADQRTIADVAGCSERTVRNRWLAARASLKAALDDHPPG